MNKENPLASKASKRIAISGIVLLIGFIMLVIFVIIKAVADLPTEQEAQLEYLDYTAIAALGIGYLILYWGFLYLMKKK
jgi:protein-S-isoprenylcysteine O-methyltransferase Ste14